MKNEYFTSFRNNLKQSLSFTIKMSWLRRASKKQQIPAMNWKGFCQKSQKTNQGEETSVVCHVIPSRNQSVAL